MTAGFRAFASKGMGGKGESPSFCYKFRGLFLWEILQVAVNGVIGRWTNLTICVTWIGYIISQFLQVYRIPTVGFESCGNIEHSAKHMEQDLEAERPLDNIEGMLVYDPVMPSQTILHATDLTCIIMVPKEVEHL